MKIYRLLFFLLVIVLLTVTFGCKKDRFTDDTGVTLSFSTDTLTFDTVFTTLGSTTLNFRAYNKDKQKVKTDVWLGGGDNSPFRINVDGFNSNSNEDVVILGEDSIFIFVEVTLQANMQNLPFVIYDSVMFQTNGNVQKVILMVWGQDAHFFHAGNNEIEGSSTWVNDKPYVIISPLEVDTGASLTIQPGTQVHIDAGSGIFVNGTLCAEGTPDEPIVFQGTRLEEFFDDLPGQYLGLFFLRGSSNNKLKNVIIKNADFGVSVGDAFLATQDSCEIPNIFSGANAPDLLMDKVIIKNVLANGISGTLARITATNTLVFNAGERMLQLRFGGAYEFEHCTFANFGSATLNHQKPSLYLSSSLRFPCGGPTRIDAEMDANFINTILYGSLDEEIEIDTLENLNAPFNYTFDHCLVKTDLDTAAASGSFMDVIFDQDPQFTDRSEDDYSITASSPCIDAGELSFITDDLANNPRLDGQPDIGAYELQ